VMKAMKIHTLVIIVVVHFLQAADKVENPVFSIERGFYETPAKLTLTTETDGAQIRYTTDCTTPSDQVGIFFTASIDITSTMVVRAIAYREGMDNSDVITHTYIFTSDVIKQPSRPLGFPEFWGEVPAKYEMNPLYPEDDQKIIEALRQLPTVSLVTDPGDMFGADGIYPNGGRDDNAQWEKAGSIEFIYPDAAGNFQENTGIQPRNQPVSDTRKRGFRFDFKSIYGKGHLTEPIFEDAIECPETAVERFDSIILRAGYMENYTGREFNPDFMIYIRDPIVRNAQLAVSGYGTHNLMVHTYVNGLYWGILNLTEAVDEDYLMEYYGGEADQWTIIKSKAKSNDEGQVVAGNPSYYRHLLDLVKTADLSDMDIYRQVTALIDPVFFADYIILQNYFAVGDWPDNNWIFTMRSYPDVQAGRFFCWDAEKSWLENDDPQSHKHAWYSPYLWSDASEELLLQGYTTVPSRIWRALIKNQEFRMLFADRIYLHLFNNGPLTNSNNLDRFDHITGYIRNALQADQKRWSDDNRRLINPGIIYNLADWQAEVSKVRHNIESNVEHFLQAFREHGLYPLLNPPLFNTTSGTVANGYQLILQNPNDESGTIYYTLNGSDPRNIGGAVSRETLNGGDGITLTIDRTTTVKARVKENDEWSAQNTITLINNQNLSALKITEIMYRPSDYRAIDGAEFEFIELKNCGAEVLNLSGVSFSQGIDYIFKDEDLLPGNQFIILARNPQSFFLKYGIYPYDRYEGNLDNNGERITISDPHENILFSVQYDNEEPWPNAANGAGYSIVSKDYNANPDPDDPDNWRASLFIHGSPGRDDSSRFVLPEPPLFPQGSKILFVVKSKNYESFPDDGAIVTHLIGRGADVTVMTENEANRAAAIGMSLVMISCSVTAGNIKSDFRDIEIPVLLWEPRLFDNMGMTGETENLDYGKLKQTHLQMVSSEHSAAGNLAGLVRINYDTDNDMTWGKPSENAVIIARWQDETTKAAIFVYEKNRAMFGLKAPARRIGFFMNEGVAHEQTVKGWQLFDAAIRWAIESPPDTAKPPDVEPTYLLKQNYPNPFNSGTYIEYSLPDRSKVELEFYTITGRRIRVLVDEEQAAGNYIKLWDGTSQSGIKLASGLYICRIKCSNGSVVFSKAKKILLIK
jgi:hypothetical protein